MDAPDSSEMEPANSMPVAVSVVPLFKTVAPVYAWFVVTVRVPFSTVMPPSPASEVLTPMRLSLTRLTPPAPRMNGTSPPT